MEGRRIQTIKTEKGEIKVGPLDDIDLDEYDFNRARHECKEPDCGSKTFTVQQKAHNCEQRCYHCDSWQKNVPKKGNDSSRSSGASSYTVEKVADHRGYDEVRCFLCRREGEQLASKQTLEVDHIKEIENEGGEDRLDNLQILCSACHKLKNHQRLYHNWHVNGRPEAEQG